MFMRKWDAGMTGENGFNGHIKTDIHQIKDDVRELKDDLVGTIKDLKDSVVGLSSSIGSLTLKIENLVDRYDKIVKYLLYTVCALALGKGLVEVVEYFKGLAG